MKGFKNSRFTLSKITQKYSQILRSFTTAGKTSSDMAQRRRKGRDARPYIDPAPLPTEGAWGDWGEGAPNKPWRRGEANTTYIVPPNIKKIIGRIRDPNKPEMSNQWKIQCKRCLRTFPDRPTFITKEGFCRDTESCAVELKARTREWRAIDKEEALRENMAVAEGTVQAHNGGVPTGTGTVEVRMPRPPALQIVEEHFDSPAERVARARALLREGLPAWQVSRRVGIGSATAHRMSKDPNYVPDFRTMEIRKAQFEAKRKREGRQKGEPTGQIRKPESLSLRDRILEALRANGGSFNTPLELRQAIAAPGEIISMHDLIHIVTDSLRRQGLVKADEKKQGAETLWSNIRLASAGYKASVRTSQPVPQAAQAPARAEAAPNGRAVAPVPTPAQSMPPARPAPQNEKPAVGFPLLRQLSRRQLNVLSAANLLREAGMNEEADLITANQSTNNPLEEEILRLIRTYNIKFE